mmetsp:Transcript_28507/g.67905  ORF Transcript_28507/g.67905 Transcript_28507/m.67905 type:complete len:116 (+) Transcript_28507:1476-1823(+)
MGCAILWRESKFELRSQAHGACSRLAGSLLAGLQLPAQLENALDKTEGARREGEEPEEEPDRAVDFLYYNSVLRPAEGWGAFPNFSEQSLREHTAIPCALFGSDHALLVQELEVA